MKDQVIEKLDKLNEKKINFTQTIRQKQEYFL